MDFREKLLEFLRQRWILVLGVVIILASLGGYFFKDRILARFKEANITFSVPDVSRPTIINGDLVLPKVMLAQFDQATKESQLHVLSANLFGVFDSSGQNSQQNPLAPPPPPPKLVGIRILGEMQNFGKNVISEISPVVRFFDQNDVEIAKKVGRITPGFDFFGVLPNQKTIYDIIVDDPPQADKMEIVLNVAKATSSAQFDQLKILSQSIEVKTAVQQNNTSNASNNSNVSDKSNSTSSGTATGSGVASVSGGPTGAEGEITPPPPTTPAEIEYYTVSGSVQNSLSDPVSDITVYVWVKDTQGHVFSFGRQDFKGDLISPKKSVDFKINLFPFKDGEKYATYVVAVWGRRYTL